MKKVATVILVLFLMTVCVYVGVVIGFNMRTGGSGTALNGHIYSSDELITSLNATRKAKGIAPLAIDNRLNSSAYMAARDMKDNQYFEHTNPKTGFENYEYVFEKTGDTCEYASENIAVVNTGVDPISVWADSKSHSDAQLNAKYSLAGFSAVKAGFTSDDNGDMVYPNSIIYVAHFCQKR